MAGNDHGNPYVTIGNAATIAGSSERTLRYWIKTGELTATNVTATATAGSAVRTAGRDAYGNTDEPTAGNANGNTAMVADTARQQLETLRDTLLAPLIEQNERLVEQVAEQAETIGRLRAEREAATWERDELRARLEALEAAARTPEPPQSAPEEHDEPPVTGPVYRIPEPERKPWWQFW